MTETKKDRSGTYIVIALAAIVIFFVGSILVLALMRRSVTPEEMAKRLSVARQIASRDWKLGSSSGKLVDYAVDLKSLPPVLPKDRKIVQTESYNDTFKTYTVFEFNIEGEEPPRKYSIQIGKAFYQVFR